MDVLDFLNRITEFNRTASGRYIGYLVMIGLIVLYVIVRGIGNMIYFALFPSKRPWRTKSFEEEEEENRNQPISDSESIGSISGRLGEDVREVWEMGYSNDQIDGVLTGKYTLEEMHKLEPEGNTISSKGKEILGNKELLPK